MAKVRIQPSIHGGLIEVINSLLKTRKIETESELIETLIREEGERRGVIPKPGLTDDEMEKRIDDAIKRIEAHRQSAREKRSRPTAGQ